MSKFENLPATSQRPRLKQPAKIRIKDIQGNVVSFGSPGPTHLAWRNQLKTSFGTVSDDFVDMALSIIWNEPHGCQPMVPRTWRLMGPLR